MRDLCWGFHVKDLDIFVDAADGPLEERLPDLQKIFGACAFCSLDYIPSSAPEVGASAVFPDCAFGPLPINVIEIQRPHGVNDFETFVRRRMDFAACQISYDDNLVRMTDQGFADLRDKVMRLVRKETPEGVERSLRRAERFQQRMPGIRFELGMEAPSPSA
ncbi:hypothetical protein [Asaia prunellae]|uniref:hypothetical protein n=1 Tax=Asaia prunellae TaxID=610245 RepID=UPI00047065D7|nr:hypothetical protein [Asaia prunellae]